MKKDVSSILRKKTNKIISISPDSTIFEALGLMKKNDIGAVLVIDDKKLVGIMTERDYARKVVLQNLHSQNSLVRDIMSNQLLYITPQNSVEECMALMTEKHIRHLPVYDQNNLIGIISIGDVVKAFIEQKNYEIEELENYIIHRR